MDKLKKTGVVLDIDHFAVHDGAGIRTCLYLKGCPLHCAWCHSPESQNREPQILFAENRCSGCELCVRECRKGLQKMKNGKRIFFRDECDCCGSCVKVCNKGALFVSGTRSTVQEVLDEILPDEVFFRNSDGGVTISGGEVLMQPEFTYEILKSLKGHQIHTIVETTGYGKKEDLLMLAACTDIFYYDFKLGDKELFKTYIGGNLELVLENLRALRQVTSQIVLRAPMIPGITDTKQNMERLYETAQEMDIRQIHILPYNSSAGAKYEWCGRKFLLGPLNTDMNRLERYRVMAPETIKVDIMN